MTKTHVGMFPAKCTAYNLLQLVIRADVSSYDDDRKILRTFVETPPASGLIFAIAMSKVSSLLLSFASMDEEAFDFMNGRCPFRSLYLIAMKMMITTIQ